MNVEAPRAEGDPKSFEEAYERLRRTIEELESQPLPIEMAMARYEEGVRYARLCNEMLDQAELRIKEILRDSEPRGGSQPMNG